MGDVLWFAACCVIVGLFAMPAGVFQYKKLLIVLANAKHRTPEKLPDGRFYYIVPESEYVDLTIAKHGEQV